MTTQPKSITTNRRLRVLVVGGGVGGLSASVALRRRGRRTPAQARRRELAPLVRHQLH